jgi:hypothetical protein
MDHPEPFKPHPNLSAEINTNIQKSEIDGGAHLDQTAVGRTLVFQTRSREYRLSRTAAGWSIVGHPKYCPVPTPCRPHGSTWGGSMLKMNWLGRGMRFEFSTDRHQCIVTSEVVEIREE